MLHPKSADKAPAQQDGQQSWHAAVDSFGARCTAEKLKKQRLNKQASIMRIFPCSDSRIDIEISALLGRMVPFAAAQDYRVFVQNTKYNQAILSPCNNAYCNLTA
jgi:hypothetical protein